MRTPTKTVMLLLLAAATPALLAANPPATAPTEKPALQVTATTVNKAQPGDKLTVTVDIKNTTDAPQTIDIPSMWWAKSDNPAVTFPTWPKFGGIGPVMTFKQQTIEPGKSFTRTWEATLGADVPPGELSFKIGLPLQRMDATVWSEPVKLTIEKP